MPHGNSCNLPSTYEGRRKVCKSGWVGGSGISISMPYEGDGFAFIPKKLGKWEIKPLVPPPFRSVGPAYHTRSGAQFTIAGQ